MYFETQRLNRHNGSEKKANTTRTPLFELLSFSQKLNCRSAKTHTLVLVWVCSCYPHACSRFHSIRWLALWQHSALSHCFFATIFSFWAVYLRFSSPNHSVAFFALYSLALCWFHRFARSLPFSSSPFVLPLSFRSLACFFPLSSRLAFLQSFKLGRACRVPPTNTIKPATKQLNIAIWTILLLQYLVTKCILS